MADPYLSEIRIVSFDFAPSNWAFADGQLLPIRQHTSLFQLLGTTFGGDGVTTFALPNFRGRTPVHEGLALKVGEPGGEEGHTLTISEIPEHNHTVAADDSDAAKINDPTSAYLANSKPNNFYSSAPSGLVPLHPETIANTGKSNPHNNMQPYLVLSFCIALQGQYPSPH